MQPVLLSCVLALGANVLASEITTDLLSPGDYTRTVQSDDRERSYLVHIPPGYNPKHPTPVVLVLHGAWTNGPITAIYSGLNRTADANNFIAVYPNGTTRFSEWLEANCETVGKQYTSEIARHFSWRQTV